MTNLREFSLLSEIEQNPAKPCRESVNFWQNELNTVIYSETSLPTMKLRA
jgi:hypothetical protein